MAAPPPQRQPPPGSGSQNGSDLDMQAVEGIPRETLVALLKRKDKEAQVATGKLEKLEERYVKVVRFNKILMEDRQSFLRFCNELLPESDAVFEEAAAQEVPINCEALLRSLTSWRGSYEAAREDRLVFQQFAELAFPGDEAVSQLFLGQSLNPEAFSTLQSRWIASEDLHNQSLASINALAREQVVAKTRELEEANKLRLEAEQRIEEMREQMTQLAREKAQMLTQRLQGGGTVEPAAEATQRPSSLPGGSASNGDLLQQERGALRDTRDALDSAERRERKALEAVESSERREQELRVNLDLQQAEAARLKGEVERLKEDGEKARSQARQLLQQKDEVTSRLQERLGDLEKEMSSNAFLVRAAEQQAGRDAEVKAQQRHMQQLTTTVSEIQRLLGMSYNQERLLKERIRELEQSQDRHGQVAGDYLKHVVMKYIEYTQKGDLKAQALVPVLCTLLSLSGEEQRVVNRQGLPTPVLYVNQAIGETISWFRGAELPQRQRLSAGSLPEALHPALDDPPAIFLDGAELPAPEAANNDSLAQGEQQISSF